MTAYNPSSDISGYIVDIYEDAWFIAREQAIMPRLITSFSDTTDEKRPRVSSTWGSVTIASLGETDDLQSQAFTPSEVNTLTPAEAGAQIFLPDTRISADPFGVRQAAAMELGFALASKINTDIIGNFTSVTGGTVGTAGATITWSYFFAAYSQLRNAKAPSPWRCVMHPYTYHRLGAAASIATTTQANAPAFQDQVTREWFVQRVANVDVYNTSDITPDASDDADGAIFNPLAFAIDMRRAPRLEAERDASRRGWELNMTAVYAHGVWRPEWAICMTFDAAAPTS